MKIIQRIIIVAGCLLIPIFLNASPIGARLCQNSSLFECYKVKRSDTWEKLFPNTRERNLVQRINRVNIPLQSGTRIAVPKDLDSDVADFSPFPDQIPPPGNKWIIVSTHPDVLAWGAYERNGTLIAWGPASGGRNYCPDIGHACRTALGHFAIYKKEGAKCISSKYPVPRGGAPMPWCMYFNGGFALHGSYEVPGYNASHGCIRILVPDAEWLNEHFTAGERNVQVIVTNK